MDAKIRLNFALNLCAFCLIESALNKLVSLHLLLKFKMGSL